MAGPIVLVGGDEFTEPAAAVDRELLALVDSETPNVAIFPAAAKSENAYLAAAHGIAYFRKLGADPYGVMIIDRVTADAPVLVAELAGAEAIYLTGGNPSHLLESLRDTLAWKHIREMHENGAVLAGSSAGAMVLGERMAFGDEEMQALGVVPGVTVLPHFERATEERIQQLSAGAEGQTYLGIDGATGCILRDGAWHVYGPGSVRVITASGVDVVESGGSFRLA